MWLSLWSETQTMFLLCSKRSKAPHFIWSKAKLLIVVFKTLFTSLPFTNQPQSRFTSLLDHFISGTMTFLKPTMLLPNFMEHMLFIPPWKILFPLVRMVCSSIPLCLCSNVSFSSNLIHTWKLNITFLNNQWVTAELTEEIRQLLQLNNASTTYQSLWDTMKQKEI